MLESVNEAVKRTRRRKKSVNSERAECQGAEVRLEIPKQIANKKRACVWVCVKWAIFDQANMNREQRKINWIFVICRLMKFIVQVFFSAWEIFSI